MQKLIKTYPIFAYILGFIALFWLLEFVPYFHYLMIAVVCFTMLYFSRKFAKNAKMMKNGDLMMRRQHVKTHVWLFIFAFLFSALMLYRNTFSDDKIVTIALLWSVVLFQSALNFFTMLHKPVTFVVKDTIVSFYNANVHHFDLRQLRRVEFDGLIKKYTFYFANSNVFEFWQIEYLREDIDALLKIALKSSHQELQLSDNLKIEFGINAQS